MEQKDQIPKTREGWIRTYEQLGSISKAARRCGIARSTLQRWIKGLPVEGLADRSKRPHKLARQRLDDETENLILEIRDTFRLGKIRICSHLLQHYQLRLSPSTVARVLKRHNKRRLKRYRKLLPPKRYSKDIPDQWALQPELTYSLQGSKITVAGNKVKLNLHYINVPLLLQYMFDNGFRIQAGPQLGLLAGAKSGLQNTDTNVKDNFQTMELGLGLGMSYVNPESDLGFDIRYNHGLSNINKNGNAKMYNRGLQAGIFYLINHH